MKMLGQEQKEIGQYALVGLICALVIASALSFYAGMLCGRKPVMTWEQIISNMPPGMKRDIAIDYCVAHRGLCRSLPMKSPINPTDGRLK